MFLVIADSVQTYFDFDPKRKGDLKMMDALMRRVAPSLKRYFHEGTHAGSAGMRMKMIGYGKFRYAVKSGETITWPVVGMALQKNYISVYISVMKDGLPIVQSYLGKLGELRMGHNNFSFERFGDLNVKALSSLFAEVAKIFDADADGSVRYARSK